MAWRATPAALAEKISGGQWWRAPHLTLLSSWLADAAFGDRSRIIVSKPPRHGKSELTSHWFPVWYLSMFPERRVILASYEADFAASWGRKVRGEIIEHGPLLGIELSKVSSAVNRWELTAGGGMVTAGVGGPITGKGADLFVIDDPVKNWDEAYSETFRQKAWEWWASVARTRLEPNASVVIVMTRWHEDDLVGKLLRTIREHSKPWDELRLPAVAEENDVLGRKPGEALWPERYDEKDLAGIREDVGELVWNGLFQQRPAPPEGGIIKRSWFRYWKEHPDRFEQVLQSWDLAFKGGPKNDYVVGQVWGIRGANRYLLDQVRAQLDFPETIRAFRNLSTKWSATKIRLVEDAANGAALVATLKDEIGGIIPVSPNASKEARLAAVSNEFEAGNVLFPEKRTHPWVDALEHEILAFPHGANDDQVDAMSQLLLRLRRARPVRASHASVLGQSRYRI